MAMALASSNEGCADAKMKGEGEGEGESEELHTLFVYGTLKKGFGNEWLTEEMIAGGHAEFMGVGRTREKYPLVCGPYQVPFLLFMEGNGHHVWGELYKVDRHALARFDQLEGTSKGESYAKRLWMKTGQAKCVSRYSEEESRNYVRRKDRPPHLTFLHHINLFLSTPQ